MRPLLERCNDLPRDRRTTLLVDEYRDRPCRPHPFGWGRRVVCSGGLASWGRVRFRLPPDGLRRERNSSAERHPPWKWQGPRGRASLVERNFRSRIRSRKARHSERGQRLEGGLFRKGHFSWRPMRLSRGRLGRVERPPCRVLQTIFGPTRCGLPMRSMVVAVYA